jgi:hypothetical protein
MVGSIERLRRQIRVRSFAPMMLLVIGVPGTPDPIAKRIGGTAGVIAIPATIPTPNGTSHGDLLPGDPRRDTRAERGRVLYSPGHTPRDTATAATRPIRKQASVDQQAVHSRGRNPAPTS